MTLTIKSHHSVPFLLAIVLLTAGCATEIISHQTITGLPTFSKQEILRDLKMVQMAENALSEAGIEFQIVPATPSTYESPGNPLKGPPETIAARRLRLVEYIHSMNSTLNKYSRNFRQTGDVGMVYSIDDEFRLESKAKLIAATRTLHLIETVL